MTDITQLSLTELKAVAYDKFAQLQYLQAELQQVNEQIAKKSQASASPIDAAEQTA